MVYYDMAYALNLVLLASVKSLPRPLANLAWNLRICIPTFPSSLVYLVFKPLWSLVRVPYIILIFGMSIGSTVLVLLSLFGSACNYAWIWRIVECLLVFSTGLEYYLMCFLDYH